MTRTWQDVLAEQENVIARWQALRWGLSPDAWEWRIQHSWQCVIPGVAVAHTGGLVGRQGSWAAALHAGPGAALSGDAALREFGFFVVTDRSRRARHGGQAQPVLDLAVPSGRRIRPVTMLGGNGSQVVCHPAAGLEAWRGRVERLPLVHPSAAALHAAAWAVGDRAAEWRLAAVVQQEICAVSQLRATLEEMPRLPRRALIRAVLDDVELGAHAGSELLYLRFCRAHGLPLPDTLQLRVRAGGTFYVDGHYRRQRVSVELDGAHHRSVGQWEADLLRSLRLAVVQRGSGNVLVRLTPSQLRYDALVIAPLLRELLLP